MRMHPIGCEDRGGQVGSVGADVVTVGDGARD